jgi:hypothetical protein
VSHASFHGTRHTYLAEWSNLVVDPRLCRQPSRSTNPLQRRKHLAPFRQPSRSADGLERPHALLCSSTRSTRRCASRRSNPDRSILIMSSLANFRPPRSASSNRPPAGSLRIQSRSDSATSVRAQYRLFGLPASHVGWSPSVCCTLAPGPLPNVTRRSQGREEACLDAPLHRRASSSRRGTGFTSPSSSLVLASALESSTQRKRTRALAHKARPPARDPQPSTCSLPFRSVPRARCGLGFIKPVGSSLSAAESASSSTPDSSCFHVGRSADPGDVLEELPPPPLAPAVRAPPHGNRRIQRCRLQQQQQRPSDVFSVSSYGTRPDCRSPPRRCGPNPKPPASSEHTGHPRASRCIPGPGRSKSSRDGLPPLAALLSLPLVDRHGYGITKDPTTR